MKIMIRLINRVRVRVELWLRVAIPVKTASISLADDETTFILSSAREKGGGGGYSRSWYFCVHSPVKNVPQRVIVMWDY